MYHFDLTSSALVLTSRPSHLISYEFDLLSDEDDLASYKFDLTFYKFDFISYECVLTENRRSGLERNHCDQVTVWRLGIEN